MTCDDCSFAGFPRDWRQHHGDYWVDCTFLRRDTRIAAGCQVTRGGLQRLLQEREAERPLLAEYQAELDELWTADRLNFSRMRWLERQIERIEADEDLGRVVRSLWKQASTNDATCPHCGYARLDVTETHCPTHAAALIVRRAA